MEPGLQTYTARSLITGQNGTDCVFELMQKSSLVCAELAVDYMPMPLDMDTALAVSRSAKAHGIKIVSCQIKYKTIMRDIPLTASCVHALGADIITLSVIDVPLLLKGRRGLAEFCRRENELYDKLRAQGIKLCHHNHGYEFHKIGKEVIMDTLIRELKGGFTPDTYWTARSGVDVCELLDKLKGRTEVMHLRDCLPRGGFGKPGDCRAGEGTLDFAQIIKKARACGVKYGVIEQNTSTVQSSITAGAQYLNSIITERDDDK